jgi:hypothetical protein
MAYTFSQSYVQLAPYLLMEYGYAAVPNPETYTTSEVGFYRMYNGHYRDQVQMFNNNTSVDVTYNVLDRSCVNIGQERFVSLDIDLIVPYNDFDPLLTSTASLPLSFTTPDDVIYDKIKLYIQSGYNLEGTDGIIFSVKYANQVVGDYTTVAQILFTKDNLFDINYEPNPILLGDKVYDKYIEVKVPNLQRMTNDYLAASGSPSTLANTLAYKITSDNLGFQIGTPILIELREISTIELSEGYENYITTLRTAYNLPQEDLFGDVNCTVYESTQGDFFEYYGTYQGSFIGDFIYFQNSIGNNYLLYNEIIVTEQIGVDFIETYRSTSLQTGNYDSPNTFRPVLKYAESDVSYTLTYNMKLVNQADNSSILRTSTLTMNDPGKWGYTITPLQISTQPEPQVIYNKIVNQVTQIMPQVPEVLIQKVEKKVPYPVFYETNQIFLESYPNPTSTLDISSSGNLTLQIVPNVENFFRFRVYKSNSKDQLDTLYSYTYSMLFTDISGNAIKVPLYNELSDISKSELAFKIDVATTQKILTSQRTSFSIIYDTEVINVRDKNKVIYNTELRGDNKEYYIDGPANGKFTGRIIDSNGQLVIQDPQVGIIQYPGFPIPDPPVVTPSSAIFRGKWEDPTGTYVPKTVAKTQVVTSTVFVTSTVYVPSTNGLDRPLPVDDKGLVTDINSLLPIDQNSYGTADQPTDVYIIGSSPVKTKVPTSEPIQRRILR